MVLIKKKNILVFRIKFFLSREVTDGEVYTSSRRWLQKPTIITAILTSNGYKVDCANDGLEGIQMYKDRNYNLILLDIVMPNLIFSKVR